MIRDLVQAMAFLQKNGVNHSDLSPESVMISQNKHVKIGNF